MLHITHHALIRYLERVRGFNFDKEKDAIRKICGAVVNGTVKAEGCVFEIKDGRLVTITPDTGLPNATKHREVKALAL
jgi:hypothetical protein